MIGLKPNEIWELTLWEYNMYCKGCEIRDRHAMQNVILTGYYTAYYTNGGKKAKNPQALMKLLYPEKADYETGIREIERIKKLDKERNDNGH